MTNWQYHQRRTAAVKAKAAEPNHMYAYCRVMGCPKPTRAGTSDGIDIRFCRSHADQYQCHGSPYRKSYLAAELNPYRQAALLWLLNNSDDPWVSNAVSRVETLYRNAGPHQEAFSLRGVKPKERARATWARLRHHKVDPRLPVAAWLAVEMIVADEAAITGSVGTSLSEFKRVQAAKLIHRMASGTHKRWEHARQPEWSSLTAPPKVEKLDVYPRSRGRVLRQVGEGLERAVELLVDHHLTAVRAFKAVRDRQGLVCDRPFVMGLVSRRRRSTTQQGGDRP